MVNSPHAQDPEVELPRSLPMGSPLESSSFDDMDAYTSKLVSVVETDAHFDSTTEGSVVASIPQSTVDEAKKFFIKMLSRDLSEIPDFAAHITESIRVLSECHDLTPAQLAQLKSLKRAIHKDLISEEAKLQQEVERLQAELAKISEKKKSAGKEMKQLHGKMVNLEQSRSSVLEEISTLETEKTVESSLSWVQQMWTELRDTFMIPNN
ncbi:uncharacterized protein LOC132311757 isoform X2 [Cornus florida]|uniref:uncharacterized protein LOC132311748 isoform X2 n=1 Tax=Cornus florida TaxID=4283 RepID=UPI002898A142|nr:uncharacterized protein LOC132311748 isoform X2 [Cornus florida]XP_059665818.1 uncharacterized protein LOC132311757 isoform X2 [Cornus florida]